MTSKKCVVCETKTGGKYCSEPCRLKYVSDTVSKPLLEDMGVAIAALEYRWDLLYRIADDDVKRLMRRIEDKHPTVLPCDYILQKGNEENGRREEEIGRGESSEGANSKDSQGCLDKSEVVRNRPRVIVF